MGYLQHFLVYGKICIQCHNNPDADTLASAYGLYCYFTKMGKNARIIYGGEERILRFNLKYMVERCRIPVEHLTEAPDTELVIVVDGQYGEGNVYDFWPESARESIGESMDPDGKNRKEETASKKAVEAKVPCIAVIDHHYVQKKTDPEWLVNSEYQSCSTLVWELLKKEDFPFSTELKVALLYGLYTDTSSFFDLYKPRDLEMKQELSCDSPVFERLTKSNMTVNELKIATDALHNHYFDYQECYAIIPVIHCEQAVLGIIGDFAIQVDVIRVSLAYTDVSGGYRISVRSCDDNVAANELAEYLCRGMGSGGGHFRKAGGRINTRSLREQYENWDIFNVLNSRMQEFLKQTGNEKDEKA